VRAGVVDETVVDETSRQLLQVAREALANAIQHADATRIEVALEQADGQLDLSVADDGRGFQLDPDATGQSGRGRGLANLRERTRQLGGELSIESSPGQGTRIRARVPLPAASADGDANPATI
jgi:signal transduction histidine kinase